MFNCPRPRSAGAGGGNDYGGFDYDYLPVDDPLDPDGVADDYSEPVEEFEVPDRYIYESNYDYAGEDLDHPEFAEVATPEDFQEALGAGAQHILITAHLDMRQSPYAPDLDGVEALNKAVGRVQNTTLSIVVRCWHLPIQLNYLYLTVLSHSRRWQCIIVASIGRLQMHAYVLHCMWPSRRRGMHAANPVEVTPGRVLCRCGPALPWGQLCCTCPAGTDRRASQSYDTQSYACHAELYSSACDLTSWR